MKKQEEAQVESRGKVQEQMETDRIKHAAAMKEPATRGNAQYIYEELVRIRENTSMIPVTCWLVVLFLIVSFLGASCVVLPVWC